MSKLAPTHQKLRGGYYTPQPIADFLAWWAIRSPSDSVLEPSCGDGILVESACADTIHRARFREKTNGKLIVAAFLNSLTPAFSEVTGRSYSGGVLELEPNEAERLPLPLKNAEGLDLHAIHEMLLRERIEDALKIADKLLLVDGLGLSRRDVNSLREIWRKLRGRRINRKHSVKRRPVAFNEKELAVSLVAAD